MDSRKKLDIHLSIPLEFRPLPLNFRTWLPTRGNVLFTLIVLVALFWTGSAQAFPWFNQAVPAGTSTGTWPYQGRLADSAGNPITNLVPMTFRIYNALTGGTKLWEEEWDGANSVQVSDGLFNVMLGSLIPIPNSIVTGNSSLWLGIEVDNDTEMSPRVQLGSVPFAAQALTVPDGSIGTAKLVDGAVTMAKIGDGAITGVKIGDNSISTIKLVDGAITSVKLGDGSVVGSKLATGSVDSSKVKLSHGEFYGTGVVLNLTPTPQEVPSLSFSVNPATAQVIQIHSTLDALNTDACVTVLAMITVDNVAVGNISTLGGGNNRGSITVVRQAVLSPGLHNIQVKAFCETGSGGLIMSGQSSISYILFSH